MTWHDLLFAHWPVSAEALRPLIPKSLRIDTFDGEAWIGVVPFGMKNIRHRLLPRLPGTSDFPELNVRTYVSVDDKPGVWFFSLDATNRLAVAVARRFFRLPYLYARMAMQRRENDGVDYRSRRAHRGMPPASFAASYRPTGPEYRTSDGELDHWLTARYCLYAADRRGHAWRGEIEHAPWSLQAAEADFRDQHMLTPLGISPADCPPLLHFAKRLDVVAWTLEPAGVHRQPQPDTSSSLSPT